MDKKTSCTCSSFDEMSRLARTKDQPLLPYQRYFIDYQLYSPDKVISNIFLCCRIPAGCVDVQALKAAVDKVFHHYAVFGTVFVFNEEPQLVQRFCPELIPDVEIVYSSEEAFHTYEKHNFMKPYRLLNTLLWRHRIVVTPDNLYLMTDFHHAIADKGSCMRIYHEIFDVLDHKEPGPDHYYLYLSRFAEHMKSAQAQEDLCELERLYGGPCSRYPKPDLDSSDNTNARILLQSDHSFECYRSAAKQHNVSLGTAFFAAGLMALSRYNKEQKVEIEWLYHGRHEAWKKDLAGLMLSGIPAAMDFGKVTTTEQILHEAARQVELGFRYCDYSYAVHNMSPGENECLKILYLPGNDDPGNLPPGGEVTVSVEDMDGMMAIAQIIILHRGADDPLILACAYQRNRYLPESIEKLIHLYQEALDELLCP